MDGLAHHLTNKKVWWHETLFWRNIFARSSVFYTFMLEGMFTGVWSYFLADIEDNLNLSDAELGTAVLFVYLGMVLVSAFTAYLLQVYGSQVSTYIGAISFGISLSFIPFAPNLGLLILTMFIYGWSMGIMDISMNSSAILTEIVAGKPLMGSFHGSYSVAAAIGSVVGGALSQSSLGIYVVFCSFSIVSVVLTSMFHSNMYNYAQEIIITEFKNDHGSPEDAEDVTEYSPLVADGAATEATTPLHAPLLHTTPVAAAAAAADDDAEMSNDTPERDVERDFTNPDSLRGPVPASMSVESRWIIAFYSMVGFLAAFGESGIVTWSTVYFDRNIHASSVLKSLGFTSFMVCMALGRFSCDYLRRKFGRRYMVRTGGALALSGLLLVVLSLELPCSIAFACIGFSITGMGLSTLIPTMFSSAGHIPGGMHAGTSIAIVSTFTNCGAIISSPLIGVVSDAFGSMQYAFLFIAILLGILFPLSWGIPCESLVYKRSQKLDSAVAEPADVRLSRDSSRE
jgi:MFS family permease